MASNEFVVTIKYDTAKKQELILLLRETIQTLEDSKHEHYTEPEGLMSCLHIGHPDIPCDCGSEEINRKIEVTIQKIWSWLEFVHI